MLSTRKREMDASKKYFENKFDRTDWFYVRVKITHALSLKKRDALIF